MTTTLASKPSLIEHGSLRFLIMDKPKDSNLHLYLKECKKHNVTDIVRICEPCYDAAEVMKSGITLHVSVSLYGKELSRKCDYLQEDCHYSHKNLHKTNFLSLYYFGHFPKFPKI